jgi:hypothetical protein
VARQEEGEKMSSSLSWHPVIPQEGKDLSTGLKWILEKRYLNGMSECELDLGSVAYLEGVMAASNKDDAKDLEEMIAAIRKHGVIRIWLQY